MTDTDSIDSKYTNGRMFGYIFATFAHDLNKFCHKISCISLRYYEVDYLATFKLQTVGSMSSKEETAKDKTINSLPWR